MHRDSFHSYWRACRTFRREARRAGSTAARSPAAIAASTKTRSEPYGTANDPLVGERLRGEQRQEHADADSERRADQGRHDALVPDHPADLAPRHPDGTQHPELTSPLEHGQDERVDHPEQAHDHGEPEQRVEDVQELAHRREPALLELLARLHLRVGKSASARSEAVFSAVTPPCMLTKVKSFLGCG